jgi:predicted transcriptional regulator
MNRFVASARALSSISVHLGAVPRGLATFGRGGEGKKNSIGDVMTSYVALTSPEDTVQKCAQLMDQEDAGAVPVADQDK